MRIAIIVGEVSGDILGSRLIQSLKKYYPDAIFEGIAGPEMQQAGCQSLYPMDRLSIMGYIEVLPRFLELYKLRKKLIRDWLNNPPDLFIGIDAPDFNLKIEKELYQANIPAVHYVSPSVWAWREWKVKKMINSMDIMLTLFPFEVDFYKKHQINALFVGHPLADEIPLKTDKNKAREILGLPKNTYILAVLPGNRKGEIKRLAPDFLESIALLSKNHPDWVFVVPLINDKIKHAFETLQQEMAAELPATSPTTSSTTTTITLIDGQSRTVMEASDQILMASGTAVLEGMLIGRPMVAAYRVAALTAFIIRTFKIMKAKYFTLPNNLANEYLVPELAQEDVSAKNIVRAIEQQYKQTTEEKERILKRFNEIHQTLKQNASERAAKALYNLLASKKAKGNK